jgi:EmrB/QacA subfamily drug resistance transporter
MASSARRADATEQGRPPAGRQRNLALLVAGTFFLENLDGTILTTAVPSIARSLAVPAGSVGVTITVYLLTLAVLIPLSGWITERFGARRVFLTAIAVFTLASLLCAASGDLLELTAARLLQGIGGAMMVPVGRLVVLRATDRRDLVHAVALLTWPALAAPVLAPLAGGLIVTYATWHWIFLINVPLGAVAFAAAWRLVQERAVADPPRLDWTGLALLCTGLGAVVSAGSLAADPSADAALAAILVAGGVVLLAVGVRHLRRARSPLLTLGSLRIETFRLAHAGGSAFRLAVNAVPFVLPLLFQEAFGWSPVLAGAIVLFLFVGNLAIKPATTPLLRLLGFRPVLLIATTGAAVTMALSALLVPAVPLPVVVVLMLLSGAARSVGFTAYNTIAFADVPAGDMTNANTLASTLQQLATGFGVAVGALLLRIGAIATGTSATDAAPYRVTFAVLAALTLLATVEAFLLTRSAGEGIRPRPRGRSIVRGAP